MDVKAWLGIQEAYFLCFNLTSKMTTLTYIDSEWKIHRASKFAPNKVSFFGLKVHRNLFLQSIKLKWSNFFCDSQPHT
jgi:hypothetical protein